MSEYLRKSIIDGRVDDIASSLLLFERMEEALKLRLQIRPRDETILNHLGICKRKQGKLDEALQLYADLAKNHPEDPNYSYAVAALKADLNGNTPKDITRPNLCPVMEWPDFLSEKAIQEMIDHLRQHKDKFRPALVGSGKKNKKNSYNPEIRNNTDLNLKGTPFIKLVNNLVLERLPEITSRLGLTPFEAVHTEVKLRAYHNGEYFRIHHDGGQGRQISYTYFFHPEPKQFTGGEFIAFDTDTVQATFNHSFTRILPKRNSVFFYPSHYYHAALPVETKNDDFMSARFVINGHIWDKKE